MLLGEHAVLHGRRALVCAIDQRMTVSATPLDRPILKIDSALGQYESPLGELEDHSDFRFVLDAVKQYPLGQGIELKIDSEFSSDIGFGSSAAVTVATHAVLGRSTSPREPQYNNDGSLGEVAPPYRLNRIDLFKRCLATVHRVQGRGSGSDLAASIFGGVVAYRAEPFEVDPICEEFPLMAVYSGSKMKTADVIRVVEERRALNPDYYEKIFDRMDASVGEVIMKFPSLGKMLALNQKLMEEMGLCNAALAEIISIFQTLGIPAKISGSGLGDCAIGLAEPTGLLLAGGEKTPFGDYPAYALNVTTKGVRVD